MNEGKSSHETLVGVALLVGLVSIAGFLLVTAGVRWYLSPENQLSIVQRRDLVEGIASAGQALAVFLTGAVGLIGLFFTWQTTNQARNATRRTLELTEQGQITDRFTKAIDQMGDTSDGNKRLEIRIGGIYALERIAQDSVQYYGQIMEILTAYLRENSPWPPKDASVLPSAESKAHKWARWRKTETISFFSGAATDVQAVLDVLGRREEARVPITDRVSFDLTETDLQGANLVGIDLAGASLVGANLQGAWLVRANLEKADLSGANLQQAWLSGARLTRARLTDARLEGAHLSGAIISDPPLQLTRIFGLDELLETGSIRIEASDLSETLGLVEEQLGLTVGDLLINVPQGLQLPNTWALNPPEQVEIIREQMKVLVSRAPDDY